jgi:HEAT repeat protein
MVAMLWWTLRQLRSREWETRERAAQRLGKLRQPRALKALIAALEDEDAEVAYAAADAIGAIGDRRAVEPLLALLMKPNPGRRPSAARHALDLVDPGWEGSDQGRQAVVVLSAALRDPDATVRRDAVESLYMVGGGALALEPLLATALQDEVATIRTEAWDSLAVLDGIRGVPAPQPLIAALHDQSADVRKSAVRVLRRIHDARSVPDLAAALSDDDQFVVREAAQALVAIGGAASVGPLISALSDDDQDTVREAAQALGPLGGCASVGPLVAALVRNAREDVHRVVSGALCQIDPDWRESDVATETVLDLAAGIRSENPAARRSIAAWLGDIGDGRAVASLAVALADDDPGVREAAAGSLAKIHDSAAVELLATALEDGNPAVSRQAALGLAAVHDARAVSPLITALTCGTRDGDAVSRALDRADRDWRKSDAARNLVPDLLAALEDKDGTVRVKAVELLGEIADDRVVDALAVALNDENWRVRNEAAVAIGKIGGPRAHDILAHRPAAPPQSLQEFIQEADRLLDMHARERLTEEFERSRKRQD